jgi:hypothetical protein
MGLSSPSDYAVRAGQHDPWYFVQSFASHRIASQAELLEALGKLFGSNALEERIGWHGRFPSSPVMFQCEFCDAEHPDCSLIEHTEDCPVTFGRRVLAQAKGEVA